MLTNSQRRRAISGRMGVLCKAATLSVVYTKLKYTNLVRICAMVPPPDIRLYFCFVVSSCLSSLQSKMLAQSTQMWPVPEITKIKYFCSLLTLRNLKERHEMQVQKTVAHFWLYALNRAKILNFTCWSSLSENLGSLFFLNSFPFSQRLFFV